MEIDPSNFQTGEFGIYLKTNGAIDARAFRDFLDILSGNTPRLRRMAPDSVEILELSNGSIRAKLRAIFGGALWGEREAAQKATALDHAALQTHAALRQAAAAELSASVALHQMMLQTEANKKLDWQNRIALGLLLATIAGVLYSPTPSREAELICGIVESGSVVCIEIASRDYHWVIERSDVANYRNRMFVSGNARNFVAKPARRRAAVEDTAELQDTAEAEVINSRRTRVIGPSPEPERIPPKFEGVVTQYGEAYRLAPDPVDGGVVQYILILPEDRPLEDGARYEVSGRTIFIRDQDPLLVANTVRKLT